MRKLWSILWCLNLSLVAGCASAPLRPKYSDIQSDITARTGVIPQWRGNSADDAAVDHSINSLLNKPLTADAAVQIALLNNRKLQAIYEDLGVAQADVVQAGLLKNPLFSAGIRFPNRSPNKTYLDFSIEEDFVDLLFLPIRKRMAATQLMKTKAKVVNEVFEFAGEVRSSFYKCQAAGQELELQATVRQAQADSYEAATRLRQAGNTTRLDLLTEQAQYERTQLETSVAEQTLADIREKLTGEMGLCSAQANWQAEPRLPELPEDEVNLTGLEDLAIRQRSDIAAAKQDVTVAAQTLGFTDASRFLQSTQLGPEGERETDGQWRIGPSFTIPIPLFDQGQAAIAAAKALLRQNQLRYNAATLDVQSQVRAARSRLLSARARATFCKTQVLPTQQQLVAQTQMQFNGMFVGVFQLLQAKRDEIEAGRQYVDALRDYWIARTDLEQAVGGRLQNVQPSTTTEPFAH